MNLLALGATRADFFVCQHPTINPLFACHHLGLAPSLAFQVTEWRFRLQMGRPTWFCAWSWRGERGAGRRSRSEEAAAGPARHWLGWTPQEGAPAGGAREGGRGKGVPPNGVLLPMPGGGQRRGSPRGPPKWPWMGFWGSPERGVWACRAGRNASIYHRGWGEKLRLKKASPKSLF